MQIVIRTGVVVLGLLAVLLAAGVATARPGDVIYSTVDLHEWDRKTGAVRQINPPLTSGGTVDSFQIGRRGRYVVYRADSDVRSVYELYAANLKTHAVGKLSLPLVSGSVGTFAIGPKEKIAVYTAAHETVGRFDLHMASLKTGELTTLNFPEHGSVTSFEIGPKAKVVMYLAGDHLYRVDLKTGVVTDLSSDLAPGRAVFAFRIGPKGKSVAYTANRDSAAVLELYHWNAREGFRKVSGPMVTGGGLDLSIFRFDRKGKSLAYLADQDTDGIVELYRVELKTRAVAKVNGPLVAGGDVLSFAFDPKGKSVFYTAEQDTLGVRELYQRVLKTGAITKLNGPLVAGGSIFNSFGDPGFEVGPKGKSVVYYADQDADQELEIYRVFLKTGVVTQVNGPLVAGGDVDNDHRFDRKGRSVVYRADQDTDDLFELYQADVKTGAVKKLNASHGGRSVFGFAIVGN